MTSDRTIPDDFDGFVAALSTASEAPRDPAPFADLERRAVQRRRARHQRIVLATSALVVAVASGTWVAMQGDETVPIAEPEPTATTPTSVLGDASLAPSVLPAGWRIVDETHDTTGAGDFSPGRVDAYVLETPDAETVRITVDWGTAAELGEVAERFDGEMTTVRGTTAVLAIGDDVGLLVWNEGSMAVTVEGPADETLLQDAAASLRPLTV